MLGTLRKKLLLGDWLGVTEDTPSRRTLIRDVSQGDKLTFGIIEQHDLSGKSCIVGIPTLYSFGTHQFQSYPLYNHDNQLLCNMIIANRDGALPYLALSRTIPSSRKLDLFTEEDYARLARGEIPYHLYVREHTAGMSDWLYMHYEVKIRDTKGTSISPENEVKLFHYGLYVSLKEQKALEIERYPSGEFMLHATVFRPITDIIAHAPHAAMDALDALKKTYAPHVAVKAVNDDNPPNASAIPPVEKAASAAESAQIFELPTAVNAPSVPAAAKEAPLPTVNSAPRYEAIQCNLRMASKLIDEALRNDIRVSDVIRKALGLRIAEMDFVAFDLRLSAKDYALLADRFEVNADDKEKIHHFIMEELSHFTGEAAE
jgi:hypothetical protein